MTQLAFIGNLAGPEMLVLLILMVIGFVAVVGVVASVLFLAAVMRGRTNIDSRLKAIEEKLDRLAAKAAN